MQILIRCFRQKPADLDLQCFQNRCSAGQGLVRRNHFHARIQRGTGSGPPLKNPKAVGFLGSPEKSQSYQASIQCWAIIGPPAKKPRQNWTPLTKLSGSAYEQIILVFYPPERYEYQYSMSLHSFSPSMSPFYTPPHFSVGILCYTLRCLSVLPSVRPCSPFLIDNLSIYSRNFFKFCIHIVIGDEWYGIVNGQSPSIFNGVTALFRSGKMVSGLLFLYCS